MQLEKGMSVQAANPLVSEYYERRRLAGLGVTAPLEDLDPMRAQAFELIARTIASMQPPPKKGRGSR
jgi:hypothetical protein